MLFFVSLIAQATFLPECGPGSFGNAPCNNNQTINCPSGNYSVGYAGGIMCWDQYPSQATQNCPTSTSMPSRLPHYMPYNRYVMNRGWPMPNYNHGPWWAQQGQFHYPNFQYPGAWEGEFTKNQKFKVNDIEYDYLFYDYRFDHHKLQYENEICSDRETIIKLMQKDLEKQNYPKVSLKDFYEHWNQKMPKINFYCMSPQYNKQLDEHYPIETQGLEIVRSLYLVVPHEKAPRIKEGQFPPLPHKWNTEDHYKTGSKGAILKGWESHFL